MYRLSNKYYACWHSELQTWTTDPRRELLLDVESSRAFNTENQKCLFAFGRKQHNKTQQYKRKKKKKKDTTRNVSEKPVDYCVEGSIAGLVFCYIFQEFCVLGINFGTSAIIIDIKLGKYYWQMPGSDSQSWNQLRTYKRNDHANWKVSPCGANVARAEELMS